MPSAIKRVSEALLAHGIAPRIQQFDASTRTAPEAAATIGTSVAQIVKSLVFLVGERPVVVLVSGANRVDIGKVEALAGAPVRRADAELVRAATGFAIGGVPPLAHAILLPVYVDHDLLQYDVVWAAAGTGNAVFPIAPADLVRVSGGLVADVALDSP